MDLSFYTPMATPNVDISLFGDAATQGIAAGKELPTKTTAAIQGAIKGVEQGLDIVGKSEQIESENQLQELRQNQIEMLPVSNELQRVQLEERQLLLEASKVRMEEDALLRQDKLEATRQTLQGQKEAIQYNREMLSKKIEFNKQFNKATPDQQAEMFFSGQYNDMFAADKALYERTLESVYNNPNLSPERKEAIETWRNKKAVRDEYTKNLPAYQEKFSKAQTNWEADASLSQAIASSQGLDANAAAEQLEYIPEGMYELEPYGGGYRIKRDYRNERVQLQDKGQSSKITGEFITVLKGSDTVLSRNVPASSLKNRNDYIFARDQLSGLQSRYAASRTSKQPTPEAPASQEPPQPQAPPPQEEYEHPQSFVNQEATKTAETKGEAAVYIAEHNKAVEVLGSAANSDEVTPLVNKLTELVKSDVAILRWDVPEQAAEKAQLSTEILETKTNLVKTLAAKEYTENKANRLRYTKSDVERHNKEMLARFAVPLTGGAVSLPWAAKMAAPFLVKTPADLYLLKNHKRLEDRVNNLFTQLATMQVAQVAAPARKSAADSTDLDYVNKTRNGL